jgi:lipoate-protein ligase A
VSGTAGDAGSREQWRYVDVGAVGPLQAMSQNGVLGGQVKKGAGPIAMTAAWGSTHLNVGWFDDVDATLDLARCRELGIEVIRRPVYGGGTAFYQEGCAVMWGFFLKKEGGTLDEKLARFRPVLLDTLAHLDLGDVQLEGSSDFRWHGRKLGALTAQDVGSCHSVGGFFNIARPDVDLYLEVVRVPDEKFKDKVVKDMREYVCTAPEVAGHPVTYEQFRDALLAALEASGIELERRDLSDDERKGIADINSYLGSDDFIRRTSSERFTAAAPPGTRVGFGNHKGRKLCRAGVALDGQGTVAAAMMAGDMHVSPPETMEQVAEALVGADSADPGDLRKRIASVFEAPEVDQAGEAMGITTDDLLAAVEKALDTVRESDR